MDTIYNAYTMAAYQGRNVNTLTNFMIANQFAEPRFATLRQWNTLGRCIKSGSKGCSVGFIDTADNNATRRGFKFYRVFNIEQTRLYTVEEQAKYETFHHRGNDQSSGDSITS